MASDETGFFARVGPLQIFVSRHCMPEDISVRASFNSSLYADYLKTCMQCVCSLILKQETAGCPKMRRLK